MGNQIQPPAGMYSRASYPDEPINHYTDQDGKANRSIKNSLTLIGQLAISRQSMDAALEALEIARLQLGVAEISNAEGTVKYTKEGLSQDSFNAEMRAVAITQREGRRYWTRRLGS